jgi:hypothetical protein
LIGPLTGTPLTMNRTGKIVGTIWHLIAATVLGLLDIGDTPWLRKELEEEGDQVGRLI